MFKPLSRPGVYDKAAARQVSKTRPKFNIQLLKIYKICFVNHIQII